MTPATPEESRLLLALQKGLPIASRPFAQVGAPLGMSGDEVLAHVRAWFQSGLARRFGAIFDSRSLGYESTLCAAEVPASDLETAVARITPHPGITHCYERDGHPNLWFTLTAPAASLGKELARVANALGYPETVLNLPALHKFKIEAVFGREGPDEPPHAAADSTPLPPLNERERRVVRHLQETIPVCEDPFGEVARELGYAADEFLALLARWQDHGIIRRIGLVVRHRQMGFSANSMCVWPEAADRIEAAGQILARNPHVTHCYERPAHPTFPYNLYAMIHATSREEAVAVFAELGAAAGLSGGRMMWSLREFKKSSPRFFSESSGA